MNWKNWLIVILLILVPLGSIFYKSYVLDLPLLPQVSRDFWELELVINAKGNEEQRKIGFPIPKASKYLEIQKIKYDGKKSVLSIEQKSEGNIGWWIGKIPKKKRLSYQFVVKIKERKHKIPKTLRFIDSSKINKQYLDSSQIDAKTLEAIQKVERDILPKSQNIIEKLKAIYYFIYDEISYDPKVKNTFDSLNQLEGNSHAKAQIFAYILRHNKIPTKVVAGLWLNKIKKDKKRKSLKIYYWNEVYIKGKWIAFCTTNGFFASLSKNYVPLFEQKDSISDFLNDKDSKIKIFAKKMMSREFQVSEYQNRLKKQNSAYLMFSLYFLPLRIQFIFKVLLLIPIGAILLAFCRNIIGIKTFGIFMPILLALFFKETNFIFGISFFVLLVGLGYLEKYLLDKIYLLAVPRLSILLTLVVIFITIFAIFNDQSKLFSNFTPVLFPIVITTIFIERFSIMMMEEGPKNTVFVLLGTFFISLISYWVLSIQILQDFIFTYPETLFAVIGILILIGKYNSYRLTELFRFKEILKPGAKA